MKPDDYAEVAEKWDSYYNNHPVTAAEDELITSVVDRLYEQECGRLITELKLGCPLRHVKVLDIGCGTGMVLEHVKFNIRDYLGVDVSPTMLKVARQKFPEYKFELDDAEDLKLPPAKSIDLLLYLFGVFPFTDPAKSLPEVARVMKYDAQFVICFYHTSFPMAGEDGYQAAFYANGLTPPMAKFYSVKEAVALVNGQPGLEVGEVVTINSYLRVWEKLIPKRWRRQAIRRIAFKESRFFSKMAPELCHHFLVIGRKVKDA